MRVKGVGLTLWKWEGYICHGGTGSDFAAFIKSTLNEDAEVGAHSAGHAYVQYGKPFAFWVSDIKDVACLAHEALHVAAGVLEGRGLKYTAESEEAYTYTMEWLMREALKPKGYQKC